MLTTKYLSNSEKLTIQEIEQLTQKIKNKDTEAWHTLMGNIVQNSKDEAYRKAVQEACQLLFKVSREDEALYVLDEESYKVIFPKMIEALYDFHQDDPEFIAITAHCYRDARFGYGDMDKTNQLGQLAIEKNNVLGMTVMTYQYFFGSGIEQDQDKAFDLADKAVLVSNNQNLLFHKGFMFFRQENYELAENIINTVTIDEQGEYASALFTLKAELALQKNQHEEALSLLEKAIQHDQSSYPFFMLGRILLYGTEAVPANPEKGVYYLEKAMEKGASYAGLFLGYYYAYNAPEPSVTKAKDYLEKAATYNNSNDAKYELARLYLYQDTFDLSEKLQALSSLQQLAPEYPSAYVDIAYHYLNGTLVDKDLEEAHKYLEQAIDKKHGYAAYYLGREYQEGSFNLEEEGAPEYDKALHWYTIGASLNDKDATEVLGRYHRLGVAGEPNPEKAIAYNQKAIELFNSDYAKVELALCYEEGFGVEEDYNKAFELYLSAAENQYPYALYKIGLYYRDGILSNDEPDFEKSFEYFTAAATYGYEMAFYELAKATYFGEGTSKDIPKALQMYQECIEKEIMEAAVDLGIHYEQQEGDENPEKAYRYMKQAAEREIPYSFYKLGNYYYSGFGVAENVDTAKKYFQVAIDHGVAISNIAMGNIEFWEEASDSKEANAFAYYQTAAEFGFYNYGLGMCYKYGIGVEKNPKHAFEALEKGVEQESELAVYHLGLCHLEGFGTPKNVQKAVETLEMIQEDNSYAQYQLAKLYLDGEDIAKNETLGIQYLTKAAESGYAAAQFMLGNMYLVGNGVEEDSDTAFDWFTKAAENGHEEAIRIIKPSSRRGK